MELLEMERPMNSWNDDRLDELSNRVDDGFKEMREGFARVDREMKEGFARVDGEMKGGFIRVDQDMKAGFAEIRGEMRHLGDRLNGLGDRFDRLLNTLVLIAWGFAGTVVAALAAVLVAALT